MTKLELLQDEYIAYLKSKICFKRKQMQVFEEAIAKIERETYINQTEYCECIGELDVIYIDSNVYCKNCGKKVLPVEFD